MLEENKESPPPPAPLKVLQKASNPLMYPLQPMYNDISQNTNMANSK